MMAAGKWRLLGVRAHVWKAMSSCVLVVMVVVEEVGRVMQCIGCMRRMMVCGCDWAFVMLCD